MKRYLVELEAGEREALEAITRKGSHRSQKVLNALVLLNCDAGECNERRATGREIAGVLRISARRVDRVKKRFVEDGPEAALGARQGRRAKYLRKADGEFEARLVALSCGDPPEGRSQWSLRLLADRAVELGYIDSVSHEAVRRVLKQNAVKPWRRIGWVIPPQRNADFSAGMERVLDVYRRPYDADFPVVCMDETPRQLIGETRTPVPPAPDQGDRAQNEDRLGPLPARHRRAVPGHHPDHAGDGQPQHGRKSSKVIQDCTICVSCHCAVSGSIVSRKREKQSRLAGIPSIVNAMPRGRRSPWAEALRPVGAVGVPDGWPPRLNPLVGADGHWDSGEAHKRSGHLTLIHEPPPTEAT